MHEGSFFKARQHKAKGLEFDNVIVTDVKDGNYPYYLNEKPEAILEDARKLYVAMTRTKATLTLMWPRINPWGYQCKRTPFVKHIESYFD